MSRLLVLLALAYLVGCGSSEPFDYVPASGKVSYEDGSLLPVRVRVVFSSLQPPVDGKKFPRPASALPDDKGEFPVVSSLRYDDGIIPGKHKVSIIYEGKQPDRYVPREYQSPATTPLEVDSSESPFDIKIKKPSKASAPAAANTDVLSGKPAR